MKLFNKIISLFIFEQDEILEIEERNKMLLANLLNFTLFVVVLVEGIYSLLLEQIVFAGPLLFLSAVYSVNYLFLSRKPYTYYYLDILLSGSFLTMLFFIVFGGSSKIGIIWIALFPLFNIPIYGKTKGLVQSFSLLGVLLFYFFVINEFFKVPYLVDYSIIWKVIIVVFYSLMIFLSYALDFISSEVILNKERMMLNSQNVSRSQEEYISRLSHQIRTPLSNITGIIDILEKTELTEDQRDFINTLHASANNMVHVVNSLVSDTKTETLKQPAEDISFNLYSLINNTLKLFYDINKNNRFNVTLAAEIPNNVLGNSLVIKQILLNVLNSIVKINKNESKTINIELVRKESMPGKVDIIYKISTNCTLPLSKDEIARDAVFNQDVIRLNTTRFVNLLDLGITQRMVEMDGNSFNIVPRADSFTVEFTTSYKESNRRSYSVQSIPEKIKFSEPVFKTKVLLKDANVLLVEDNFSNQQIIILYLKNEINRIDVAFNGKEALDKFGKAKYDLILMDVQMPIMDGFKATQKIREIEHSSNSHTPIIAVTANAFPEDRERCFAAGMDDYITKPFQPDELIQKITMHLG